MSFADQQELAYILGDWTNELLCGTYRYLPATQYSASRFSFRRFSLRFPRLERSYRSVYRYRDFL
jgi:hypothetical protein